MISEMPVQGIPSGLFPDDGALDPAGNIGHEWTNEKPGDKVGQDQRLPAKMGQEPKHPCEQDT